MLALHHILLPDLQSTDTFPVIAPPETSLTYNVIVEGGNFNLPWVANLLLTLDTGELLDVLLSETTTHFRCRTAMLMVWLTCMCMCRGCPECHLPRNLHWRQCYRNVCHHQQSPGLHCPISKHFTLLTCGCPVSKHFTLVTCG